MKVISSGSFVYFVYPFLYNSQNYLAHAQAVEARQWSGEKQPIQVWEEDHFPDEGLLKHVAEALKNPTSARLWKMSQRAMESRQSGLGFASNVSWRLLTPHVEVPISFSEVKLILFRIGVGFAVLQVRPASDEAPLEDWLDLLHYFRYGRGQKSGELQAQARGFDPQTRQPLRLPFFPAAAGGLEAHPAGAGQPNDLLEAVLNTASIQANSAANWWQDVFVPGQWLPFASLFVHLPEVELPGMPRLLYRLRNFFHAQQEVSAAAEELRLDHPNLLPYAEQGWFFFSLEGGGFFTCNPPENPFFSHNLPNHLREQYFLLFLLALQQRFVFMMLLDDVACHWPEDGGCLQGGAEQFSDDFERIRDKLLSFTARGYFAQAAQNHNHNRFYQRWQEIFQLERLYQETSDEVRYMSDYLAARRGQHLGELEEQRRKQTENLESKFSLFALLFGPPALFLAVLDAVGNQPWWAAGVALFGGLGVGSVLYLTLWAIAGRGQGGK